jgi:hypothetical protein
MVLVGMGQGYAGTGGESVAPPARGRLNHTVSAGRFFHKSPEYPGVPGRLNPGFPVATAAGMPDIATMKRLTLLFLLACGLILPAMGQLGSKPRKSLLEDDPEVVYLTQLYDKPILLTVAKAMPVFSDKNGKVRAGTLAAGQKVPVEAITERAYRVRGKGARHDLAGWVSPLAFTSDDPDFVNNFKKLYDRQMAVQKLIAERQAALGMTPDEVSQALGKPTKTTVRKTAKGESGSWEFIEYKVINHYTTEIDRLTGQVYRRFAYATQEEKSKTVVEFTDGVVSALEESENNQRGANVRIVVPPIVFGW